MIFAVCPEARYSANFLVLLLVLISCNAVEVPIPNGESWIWPFGSLLPAVAPQLAPLANPKPPQIWHLASCVLSVIVSLESFRMI